MKNFFKQNTALIISTLIVVALSMALTLPNVSKPFYGHHEFNGVFYSQIARNFLRHGIFKTKLLQVTTPADVPEVSWGTHTHHPATYPLLLALTYGIGGEHESVARLLSILATCISIGLFASLGKKLTGKPTAILMLIPLILTPLWRYYTRMPVFEPILLPLTLWLYLAYLNKNNRQIAISSLLLVIVDWPGYWPIGGLMLYETIVNRKLTGITKAALKGLLIGSAAIIAAQWISTGRPFTDLLTIGTYRMSVAPYAPMEWIRLLISRTKAFFGIPVILMTIAGIALGRKNKQLQPLFFISLFAGYAHIFVFRNITWYHDYMLYHLLPFLGIAAMSLAGRFKRNVLVIAIISVLTWWLTNPFFTALAAMTPHRDCYTIGEAAKTDNISVATVSSEKAAECGPFIYYYADKTVILKSSETP